SEKEFEEYNEGHNDEYNENNDDECNNTYSEYDEEDYEENKERYNVNGNEEYNEYYEEYKEECSEESDEEFNKDLDFDAAFNEILEALEVSEITLYKLQKLLGNLVPFKPTLVDCCVNSCIAFTNNLINVNYCPECNEPRYKFGKTSGAPRKNIALMVSTDGYQIFYQKRDDCWVVLFINANIPPDIRVQHVNLMISVLIPGPRAPKNFNTFLQPLINELKQLQEGIQCIDGATEETFILRAYILSWSGDILALAKIMCTTGHNSYKACRFCSIHGVCCNKNQHVYFSLKPPNNIYLLDVATIKYLNGSSRKREVQERGKLFVLLSCNILNNMLGNILYLLGVNDRSILFELKSIRFPDSFPVDIMHGLFENIAPAMLRHWSGSFFRDSQFSSSEYIIPNNAWAKIGKPMEKNKKNMPLSFGCPPINIQCHSAAFKAEHWLNWITLYSIPLLQGNLLEWYA
ncbi:16657_t:CDS:2, partial [Gigaspora margarita]